MVKRNPPEPASAMESLPLEKRNQGRLKRFDKRRPAPQGCWETPFEGGRGQWVPKRQA